MPLGECWLNPVLEKSADCSNGGIKTQTNFLFCLKIQSRSQSLATFSENSDVLPTKTIVWNNGKKYLSVSSLHLLRAVSRWRLPPQKHSCFRHPRRSCSGPPERQSRGRDHNLRAAGGQRQESCGVSLGYGWRKRIRWVGGWGVRGRCWRITS